MRPDASLRPVRPVRLDVLLYRTMSLTEPGTAKAVGRKLAYSNTGSNARSNARSNGCSNACSNARSNTRSNARSNTSSNARSNTRCKCLGNPNNKGQLFEFILEA
ncbi:hypothetical protein L211DRAFT_871564 [Terfezia boudieri ATCC MYA-4762]|uniref:Uncharacterized protein n=1 Tax=Terfezia boudieri ATCC MYA-4762 TaxID=1051890 RepID=A0A3N4LBP1_9PEZI|nr:hypothetical protein L211DRAFT_871564 [Terfezia boudieri ATCC MYA-4762]